MGSAQQAQLMCGGGVFVPTPAVDLQADTLALSDGATVSPWTDVSGNSNNALLTTGTAVYKATAGPGSRPCVRFDGICFFTLTSALAAGPYTVFAIFDPSAGAAYRTIVGGTTNSFQWRLNTIHKLEAVKEAAVLEGTSSTAVNTSGFQQVNVTQNGTGAGNFRLNSAADGSYSAVATITQTMSKVGTEGAGLERFNGDMCMVRIYTSALTTAQIQSVEAAMATRWGVT